MRVYRVAFIGHRRIEQAYGLEDKIEAQVSDLLRSHSFVEFYMGRNGDFDVSAAAAVKRAQRKYGTENSSLILVQAYPSKNDEHFERYYDEIMRPVDPGTHYKAALTRRNEWMIDNADFLISYVNVFSGGAYRTLEYAKSKKLDFINLAFS